ncbi:hypothetical protein LTS18_009284 [Coniosporium uncinatum]|uniref:Uncharacterized protein n=1 Tax=Coniosporium uncinatum TaxID=93489 RepID=A0ACC3DDD2_9PEZI|nr:hypothetical protein LTS18_009284 [Coniosporium uncinatum]
MTAVLPTPEHPVNTIKPMNPTVAAALPDVTPRIASRSGANGGRGVPTYFDSPQMDADGQPSFEPGKTTDASRPRYTGKRPSSSKRPLDDRDEFYDADTYVEPNTTRPGHTSYPPPSMYRQTSRRVSDSNAYGSHARRPSNAASQHTPFITPPKGQYPTERSMSFYDMKQAQKLPVANGKPFPLQSRDSYAGSAYAGYYGGDALESQIPRHPTPHMGLPPTHPPPRGEPPSGMSGLPWTMWMNSTAKNHFVATIGEFVGTTMFLFFAFAGTQVSNVNDTTESGTTTNATTGFDPSKLLYIALCFGFSLMVNVWIFFRISGGLFNPAVTLALLLTGAIGMLRSLCLFVAQIVGAIAASALVLGIFPAPLNVQTTLSDNTSVVQGTFIEAFLTAELVFTILMLAKEKHRSTFIAPVGIGLALFIAELVGVYYTGGSLNPARSIGPAIVGNKWDSNHWVYWVGPLVGCLIAIAFYKFIKLLEYEMANPGQDADDWNDPTKNPDHELRERQRAMTARVLHSLGLGHLVEEGGGGGGAGGQGTAAATGNSSFEEREVTPTSVVQAAGGGSLMDGRGGGGGNGGAGLGMGYGPGPQQFVDPHAQVQMQMQQVPATPSGNGGFGPQDMSRSARSGMMRRGVSQDNPSVGYARVPTAAAAAGGREETGSPFEGAQRMG